uniref:Uncharacterized protein n=1 Tax=Strix occidentalis caurina TaxID=311401 RepID=A0A8D0FQ67_STROC
IFCVYEQPHVGLESYSLCYMPILFPSPPRHTPTTLGFILSWGDKDFPPTAAPVAHQRPQPCLEKLPLHINQLIQQEEPRV